MNPRELKLQTEIVEAEITDGMTLVGLLPGKGEAEHGQVAEKALRDARKAHQAAIRRLTLLRQYLSAGKTARLQAKLAALEQAIAAARSKHKTVSVEYLGTPYAGARRIDGIWHFKGLDGKYHRFVFQDKVRRLK
jgi:hypothetical protein